MIRIVVWADPNIGSKNQDAWMHRMKRERLRAEAYNAARMAWIAARKPKMTQFPVVVDVLVRRARLMDESNLTHSTTWAAVMDALFKKAITPDDSPKYVRLGRLDQETGARWKSRAEMVITVAHWEGDR